MNLVKLRVMKHKGPSKSRTLGEVLTDAHDARDPHVITDKSGKTQLGSTNALAQNVEPGQTAVWDAPSTVENAPAGAVCKVATVQRTAST